MQIYNSMTHKKETFIPLEEGRVRMYACGPTVYNYFHRKRAALHRVRYAAPVSRVPGV